MASSLEVNLIRRFVGTETDLANPAAKRPLVVAPISALLMGLFVLALGNGLQGTLVAVRAGLEGLQEETVGIIMSAYFVGYVLGTVIGPKFVHRVGHIRTFATLASLASAATLAHLLIIDPVSWSVFRAINGFCIAGLSVVTESWLNGHAAPERRGQILSIYGILVMGGIGASQFLLSIADPGDFFLFCLVSICISLSLIPVSLTHFTAPTVTRPAHFNFKQLYALSPLGVIGTLITGLTINAFVGMGPTFAQTIGLDIAGISAFMAAMMIGTLFLQWPIGWFSDQMDRRWVIAFVAMANGLVCLALWAWATPSLAVLLPLAFLLGGLGQPLYSICIAHVNDRIPADDILSTAGTLLLIFGIGSVFGPFLASLTMGRLGPTGLFLFVGLFYFILLGLTLYRMKQNPKVAPEGPEESFASTYTPSYVGAATYVGPEAGSSGVESEVLENTPTLRSRQDDQNLNRF